MLQIRSGTISVTEPYRKMVPVSYRPPFITGSKPSFSALSFYLFYLFLSLSSSSSSSLSSSSLFLLHLLFHSSNSPVHPSPLYLPGILHPVILHPIIHPPRLILRSARLCAARRSPLNFSHSQPRHDLVSSLLP